MMATKVRIAALGVVLVLLGAAVADARLIPHSTRSNRAVARRDAPALVHRLQLPPGARVVSSEPAGDHGYLSPMRTLETDFAHVVAHAWWTVPGAPASVLAYIRTHPPTGGRLSGTGGSGNTRTGTSALEVSYSWPAVRDVLGSRLLEITVTALPGGRTGLLAEAQSDWIVVRPASERIPAGVARIVIRARRDTTGRTPNRRPSFALSTTSPVDVARIVRLIDGLPIVQPITTTCPDMGPNPTVITMSFDRRDDPHPVATLGYTRPWPGPSTECDSVSLSIEGHAQDALLGGTFMRSIGRILGRPLS